MSEINLISDEEKKLVKLIIKGLYYYFGFCTLGLIFYLFTEIYFIQLIINITVALMFLFLWNIRRKMRKVDKLKNEEVV